MLLLIKLARLSSGCGETVPTASSATKHSVTGKASQMPTICPTAASKKAMGKMMKNPRSKEIAWAGRGRSMEVKYNGPSPRCTRQRGQAMKVQPQPLLGDGLQCGVAPRC